MKKPAFIPDISGLVSGHLSARHLSGALVAGPGGKTLVVTARHLGAHDGQKVIAGGEAFTLVNVRGIDIATSPETNRPAENWRDDEVLNGDVTVAELTTEPPRHLTRYAIAEVSAGTGFMLQVSGKLTKFPIERHPTFRRWLHTSIWRQWQFGPGDSGRPILVLGRDGRTMISGPCSRQGRGGWALLRFTDLL